MIRNFGSGVVGPRAKKRLEYLSADLLGSLLSTGTQEQSIRAQSWLDLLAALRRAAVERCAGVTIDGSAAAASL